MLPIILRLSAIYILDMTTNHYCINGKAKIFLGLYYCTSTNNLSILINKP